MNEMIERAAKAMFCRVSTNYNPAQHWDELVMMPAQNNVTNHYRNMADAAIKALREPTEGMIGAALVQPYPTVQEAGGLMEQAHAAAKLEWQAMIDSILE